MEPSFAKQESFSAQEDSVVWKLKVAVVVALLLAMGTLVLWFAQRMEPVKEGNAAAFWNAALRIRPDKTVLSAEYAYEPKDGWFLYERTHMHGSDLFRVRVEDVLADLPRVVRMLEEAPAEMLGPDVEEAYSEWLHLDPTRSDGVALVRQLRASLHNLLIQNDPRLSSYWSQMEALKEERWQRAQRYHWNAIAEFLFLGGLILVAAWPWLRRSGPVRWAIHLGVLPILFFLPFWLGYASLAFTSAGPVGGCLYPWLLGTFRGLPWTRVDTAIISKLPRVLEPLSQTPGPVLSLTGFGAVGLVAACLLGLMLSAMPFLLSIVRKGIKNRRHFLSKGLLQGNG